MAYLVFSTHKGKEIGSRRLDGPVTIGRSPDCDVSLHDIQLSRNHCRVERTREGWVVADLGSKNGTSVDGRNVSRHPLRPGEVFRIGRVDVTFRAGKLAPGEEKKEKLSRPKRPADPFNASEGTVAGFRYEPPAGERSVEKFPTPKPVLTDSGRFVAQDLASITGADDDADFAAPGHARSSSFDSTIITPSIPRPARPKAPPAEGGGSVDLAPAAAAVPAPPLPPMRLRVRAWVRSLHRGLRRPLARWAALFLCLGALGMALAMAL